MASGAQRPKLVVIVGPTASGKSELAMRLAHEFNGEIICADSRTIYKGMDIGTAKPSKAEQEAVPHWGLDLVNPGQSYSAAKFKNYAEDKIKDIQNRGKLPILAGGTGLYIDSILYDFSFIKSNILRRLVYTNWSVEKMQKLIQQRDWPMPENQQNPRHLARTIERRGQTGSKRSRPDENTLLIGLMPPDKVLKDRIAARAEAMFEQDIIDESKNILEKHGRRAINKTGGIVYSIVLRCIDGEITEEQAKELFKTADWQYARRQKTWFKRNPNIKWFNGPETAYKAVKKRLVNT